MRCAADELLDELARLDTTLAELATHAGAGPAPDLLRRLDAHGRSLRILLGGAEEIAPLTADLAEAAAGVLAAADPAGPLRMLGLARERLGAVLQRRAAALALGAEAA